jgi:hypothetical protein
MNLYLHNSLSCIDYWLVELCPLPGDLMVLGVFPPTLYILQ